MPRPHDRRGWGGRWQAVRMSLLARTISSSAAVIFGSGAGKGNSPAARLWPRRPPTILNTALVCPTTDPRPKGAARAEKRSGAREEVGRVGIEPTTLGL